MRWRLAPLDSHSADRQSPEELETLGQDTPTGRAGQPGELAPAYVLLASPEGSYMSGNVVAVTGGVPIPKTEAHLSRRQRDGG